MFRIVLGLVLFFTLALSFEVSKNTTFTKKLVPTLMSNSINATMQDKRKRKIQDAFKRAINIASREKICTNGSYRITPTYKYNRANNQSEKVFTGYSGYISFDCKFKDTKKLDRIISKIDRITSKDKLKLTINPIRWSIEELDSLKANEELELIALQYAPSYQTYLSKVFLTKCTTKKIELKNNTNYSNRPTPLLAQELSYSDKSSSTKPIKNDFVINYSASYIFECK